MHVIDRWHLLRNLSEALQEVVNGHHAVIRSVARPLGDERAASLRSLSNSTRPATAAERRKLARHTYCHARNAEVLCLHAAGALVTGLARHLGLYRKTVRPWLRRDEPPRWAKPPRPSVLYPYRAYLDRRWAEGCRDGAALARELDGLGARIKPPLIRTWAMRGRRVGAYTLGSGIAAAPPPWKPAAPRRLARLLQSDVGAIGGEHAVFIEQLWPQAPNLAGAAEFESQSCQIPTNYSF